MQNVWRYLSIVICAAACWLIWLIRRRREDFACLPAGERLLPPAAMAATLAADTFLVLLAPTDARNLAGVLCFCLVQTLYAVLTGSRLTSRKGLFRANILCRAAALALILTVLAALRSLDILSAAAAFSIAMLLMNSLFAWIAAAVTGLRGARTFALGLTLFLGCDLCVGLYNMPAYLPDLPAALSDTAGTLIWFFYLPSQILIVLAYGLRTAGQKE